MTLRNCHRILTLQLILLVLLLAWSLCRTHGGTVRILNVAPVVHYQWANVVQPVVQVSSNGVDWVDYDRTVYSAPVVDGSRATNGSVGFVRAVGCTNWVELVTNQVQGLNYIGSEYLKAFTTTNTPPLPE